MADKKFTRDTDVFEVEDAEVIYRGEPMTAERARVIAAELRATRVKNLTPGGKSMTAPGAHSPVIQFRVSANVRQLAEAVAEREGLSLSKLGRRALDEYLERHAG